MDGEPDQDAVRPPLPTSTPLTSALMAPILVPCVLVADHLEKVEEEEDQLKGENAGGKRMKRKTYLLSLQDMGARPPSSYLTPLSSRSPSILGRKRKGREGSEVAVRMRNGKESSDDADHAIEHRGQYLNGQV